MIKKILAVTFPVLLSLSCSDSNPHEWVSPSVQYMLTESMGGTAAYFEITDQDTIIFHDVTPTISHALSSADHDELLNILDDFEDLPSDYHGLCYDSPLMTMKVTDQNYHREINAAFCGTNSSKEKRFQDFSNKMINFRGIIASKSLPWSGIETSFSLDSSVYSPDPTIKVTMTLHNVSLKDQTVYFFSSEKIGFYWIEGDSGYFQSNDTIVSVPLEPVDLKAGEQIFFSRTIDHLKRFDGRAMGTGSYSIDVSTWGTSLEAWRRISFTVR